MNTQSNETNNTAAHGKRPISERVIDLADVPPAPDELPYLFGDYLLEGCSHWITGKTGIGKSTFAYNVTTAIAEGRDLWGTKVKQRRVLFIDLETGDVGRSIKIERLYENRERPRGCMMFMRERIQLPAESNDLLTFVKENHIDLVVFDTARRCFQVDSENDNAEVYAKIIPVLDALKVENVASLVFGHPAKNGQPGARGAGAQEDAGDINLTLTMHRGEVTDKNGIILLQVTKHRLLGLDCPKLFLRRIGDDQFEAVALEEAGAGKDAPTQVEDTLRAKCASDIVDYLIGQTSPVRYTTIIKTVVEKGHAEGTAKHALTDLTKNTDVLKNENGYVINDRYYEN